MNKTFNIAVALLVLAGCSGPSEQEESTFDQTKEQRAPLVAVQSVAGFRMLPQTTGFHLEAAVQKNVNGMIRLEGTDGVFATLESGMAFALPNADAPRRLKPALTSDGASHNARVVAYFAGAGLPRDQIDGINAHATMHQALDPTKPQPDYTSKPVFDWYSSVISRRIEGIQVLGSFAWARFNVDDEVVAEGSYWPEVPVDVLQRAHSFQSKVSDGVFQTKLPKALAALAGDVVIHHTPGDLPVELKFAVSYDVERPLDQGMSRAIHFNESGQEFLLDYETSAGHGSARK